MSMSLSSNTSTVHHVEKSFIQNFKEATKPEINVILAFLWTLCIAPWIAIYKTYIEHATLQPLSLPISLSLPAEAPPVLSQKSYAKLLSPTRDEWKNFLALLGNTYIKKKFQAFILLADNPTMKKRAEAALLSLDQQNIETFKTNLNFSGETVISRLGHFFFIEKKEDHFLLKITVFGHKEPITRRIENSDLETTLTQIISNQYTDLPAPSVAEHPLSFFLRFFAKGDSELKGELSLSLLSYTICGLAKFGADTTMTGVPALIQLHLEKTKKHFEKRSISLDIHELEGLFQKHSPPRPSRTSAPSCLVDALTSYNSLRPFLDSKRSLALSDLASFSTKLYYALYALLKKNLKEAIKLLPKDSDSVKPSEKELLLQIRRLLETMPTSKSRAAFAAKALPLINAKIDALDTENIVAIFEQ